MRSTIMAHWLTVAFAGLLAVQASVIPGLYMVQYEDDQDPATMLANIRHDHDVEVRQILEYQLFKGINLQFSDLQKAGSGADALKSMPGVKRVWQSRVYKLPEMKSASTGKAGVALEQGPLVGREVVHDTFSPHVMTQINLLRDAGIVGNGFKISFIDSGVDYLHPALSDGFGPGHRVSSGYDFVGDAYNASNTPIPDDDPMDICNGHGTHVAGIMAAQPDKNPYGIIGAATGITLGAYRAAGCLGLASDGPLVAAYHKAYEDGANLIHSSIGGNGGWPEDFWSATVSAIVAKGVPCTLSAGNDGNQGLFFSSHAADGLGITAVGSINNVIAPSLQVNATYSVNSGGPISFGFTPEIPGNFTAQTLPLWTPITNTSDILNQDIGCEPFDSTTTPNLSGSLVLMPRGGCAAKTKVARALQWGAKHVLLYNNVAGTNAGTYNVSAGKTPIGMVTPELGAEWVKLLVSGAKVNVNMVDVATAPVVLNTYNNTLSGGTMSTYSSWGPTFELAVKPQFSAPGRDILSLWPRNLGSYLVDSGTSMSGPLVAAMYVLLMEKTGIKEPAMLGRLISATAKQLEYNDGLKTQSGVLAPVPLQGAGMVQIYEASVARTVFGIDSLAFNDSDHFVAEKNFTILNLGNDTLQYRLDHTPAATAYTFDNDTSLAPSRTPDSAPQPKVFPNELTPGHATLEFAVAPGDGATPADSPESFSIPGGKQRVVTVRVTKPTGLDDGRFPVWSGWIRLTGNDGSKLSLPYQGLTGSLHSRVILDANNTYLRGANDGLQLLGPRTFLMPPPGKANLTRWSKNNDTDQPNLVLTKAMGTPLVRADLVVVDVPKDAMAKLNITTILGTKTAGLLAGFPFTYQSRGTYHDYYWDGSMDDGTYVPEGVYKINIKALHIYGDPNKRGDYDELETVTIGVRYAYDI